MTPCPDGREGYARADDGSGVVVRVVAHLGAWRPAYDLEAAAVPSSRVFGTEAEVVGGRPARCRRRPRCAPTHAAVTAEKAGA